MLLISGKVLAKVKSLWVCQNPHYKNQNPGKIKDPIIRKADCATQFQNLRRFWRKILTRLGISHLDWAGVFGRAQARLSCPSAKSLQKILNFWKYVKLKKPIIKLWFKDLFIIPQRFDVFNEFFQNFENWERYGLSKLSM